ncbi:hypothetical protein [Bacillus sp. MUM 116]|uniref:hypothetical protein n=1 Tax=Bacillus sp. MUM 116 TaxID=1678002 RepID=UPI00114D3EDF|nr:hypothetical protein [Bacillus sp. MUM 116]
MIESITPISIILDLNKKGLPREGELKSSKILTALSFIPDCLNDYSFKIVKNYFPILGQINENVKRNPILTVQYSDISLINYCEEIKKNNGISNKYRNISDNKNFILIKSEN